LNRDSWFELYCWSVPLVYFSFYLIYSFKPLKTQAILYAFITYIQ